MTRKRKSSLPNRAESPLTPVSEDEDHNPAKKYKLSADAESVVQPGSLSATGAGEVEVVDSPATKVGPPASARRAMQKVAGEYVKHGTFWLLDGTTLVQIRDIRFKLHRSTLVEQSKWFKDMIENPPHDRCIYADGETGAIVYCLDSLEIDVNDFVALLSAIRDSVTFTYNPPTSKFVAAMLRAADALDFFNFKDYAIRYFCDKWPDNVQSVTIRRLKYAADMVLLARRCGINYVLKRALYELVRASGFRQETDSSAEDDDEINSDRSDLSASDYSLLLHVREQLTDFWTGKAIPYSVACISPKESDDYGDCAVATYRIRSAYMILVHESKIFEKYRYDPIGGLDAIQEAPWVSGEKWPSKYGKDICTTKSRLCSACGTKWRNIWDQERKKLWNDLDTWFELINEDEQDDTEGLSN
ncbi:hypothetical protein F5887DRAFT_932667 [Amanita rubescens]|nr:hypothetical protein F5887DRAFT_932667 [Amanita rubescens]